MCSSVGLIARTREGKGRVGGGSCLDPFLCSGCVDFHVLEWIEFNHKDNSLSFVLLVGVQTPPLSLHCS